MSIGIGYSQFFMELKMVQYYPFATIMLGTLNFHICIQHQSSFRIIFSVTIQRENFLALFITEAELGAFRIL